MHIILIMRFNTIIHTFIKYFTPLQRENNYISSYGIRSLFTLLCWLTSQLLVYCVHISLSTCYDWPTNPLLLLTVSAVCINLSAVSCCQRGSVLCEKTSARQAALNTLCAAARYCTNLEPGSRPF